MKKSDLKSGYVVKMRNDDLFIVIDGGFINIDGFMPKVAYDDDILMENKNTEYDIVKVFYFPNNLYEKCNICDVRTMLVESELVLLWERDEPKKEVAIKLSNENIDSEEALNALEDIELALGIDSCKETSLIRKYINQRSL